MSTNAELIAAVVEAFQTKRPTQFTLQSPLDAAYGDDERDRAEAMFASRTPDTLHSTDVGIGAGWPEVFLIQPALDYFMPAFVRLVLEAVETDHDRGFQIDDFLSILAPNIISRMS